MLNTFFDRRMFQLSCLWEWWLC